MTIDEPNQGECPYCGVYVRYTQMAKHENQVSNRVDTVYVYRCANDNCAEMNIVLSRGSRWTRFPARQPHDIHGVPANVMEAYREAVVALEAGAPRAAACMIRRCVGSAATEQGVPDEENGRRLGLQTRIDRLQDKLLPATHAAARAARILGDAGAHEEAEDRLGEINPETVAKTIAVVRQFLNNLYELPKEIEELGVGQDGSC